MTRSPFHLEATVRVLQRRPANRVDVWEGGRYLRVLSTADSCVLVEVEDRGTIDEPDVRFVVRSGNPPPAHRATLGRTLRRVLGLDVDPQPFQNLALAEPTLRAAALALRGLRPPRFAELFEAFASVVPFQQVSLDAGVAIVGRLVERFGQPVDHAGRRYYAFPTARIIATADEHALRACGLSSRKAQTLQQLSRAIESGRLDEEHIACLTTNDALASLRELPGIGPWSAGLVLLRGFGRLDVFPPADVGATRTLSTLSHREPGPPLCRLIERFGNLRGYLYFLGLAATLLQKGLIVQDRSGSDLKAIRAT
ncbi:MAG: DNA-3-methyladenine glycosylase family protein [Gammaproteobacteria bacterium]